MYSFKSRVKSNLQVFLINQNKRREDRGIFLEIPKEPFLNQILLIWILSSFCTSNQKLQLESYWLILNPEPDPQKDRFDWTVLCWYSNLFSIHILLDIYLIRHSFITIPKELIMHECDQSSITEFPGITDMEEMGLKVGRRRLPFP